MPHLIHSSNTMISVFFFHSIPFFSDITIRSAKTKWKNNEKSVFKANFISKMREGKMEIQLKHAIILIMLFVVGGRTQ